MKDYICTAIMAACIVAACVIPEPDETSPTEKATGTWQGVCLDLCTQEQALHCPVFDRGQCRNDCVNGHWFYRCQLEWIEHVECKRALINSPPACTAGEPTVEVACATDYAEMVECWIR